jgi:hypothetical protein
MASYTEFSFDVGRFFPIRLSAFLVSLLGDCNNFTEKKGTAVPVTDRGGP